MATDETPITLCKILSQTRRVVSAHPRHFSALSALFLLPISISAVLFISHHQPPPQPSPKPQLLYSLLYSLSTLPFSLCAVSSITYATFVAHHNKPVELLPSLRSILASFFPLLATRFLTLAIIWLITFAFLPRHAGRHVRLFGLENFGLDMGYVVDARYYFIVVIVFCGYYGDGVIYLEIKWCLSSAVVVLESRWGYASLKRSSYLVHGTRKVALELFLLFGLVSWGLSMWYFHVMMTSRRSKGLFCVEMVVYVVFTTVLSLYGMVAYTLLFINCKASRGEIEDVVVMDEEIGGGGGEYVALLKA